MKTRVPNPEAAAETAAPGAVDRYPLAPGQREILLLGEFGDGADTAFNEALRIELPEPVDVVLLTAAFDEFSRRHPILRSTLDIHSGEQQVHPDPTIRIEEIRLSPGDDLETTVDRLADQPIDLANGPPARIHLIHTGPSSATLLTVTHHAVCDGWSSGILIRELGRIYRALSEGRHPKLPPAAPYREFVEYEKQVRQGKRADEVRAFWQSRLSNPPAPLDLPPSLPGFPTASFSAESLRRPLDAGLVRKLRQVSKSESRSLFGDQLGVWAILLSRITGQTDFLTAIPQAGHLAMGATSLVGQCVRTLPIRLKVNPDVSTGEFLESVTAEIDAVMAHADTSLSELASQFDLPRCRDFPAFVTTTFSLLPRTPDLSLGGSSPAEVRVHPRRYWANELGAWVIRDGSQFHLEWLFNRQRHDRKIIEGWMDAYIRLLEAITENPGTAISQLPLLSDDRRAIQKDFSESPHPYRRDATIDGLFTEVAKTHADKVALRGEAADSTYADLDRRATSIAAHLQRRGISPGKTVAVHLPRSPERITTYLAILRCGATVMPLDQASPGERLKALIEDANAFAVVSGEAALEQALGIPVIPPAPAGSDFKAPGHLATDPAFLLYTSGSTGTPKGVVIPHRAIVRLALASGDLATEIDDVFLNFAPASFDASLFEIWSPLLNGATVVIPAPGTGLQGIADAIRDRGVNTLWLTAGLFQTMVDEHLGDLAPLRRLLTGGDVVSPTHAARVLEAHPSLRLVNGYGPTECTTFATTHPITEDDCRNGAIPIGVPVANTTVEIADANGQPLPLGSRGEIVIGGDAVSLGYHGRDDGAPFFIEDGKRCYRTGDIGRKDGSGILHFEGRDDRQIKVRGYRIEPAEVEAVIARFAGVKQVRVASREGSLAAWIATENPESFDARALRDSLSKTLPDWMCPPIISALSALPLDRNGKITTDGLRVSSPSTSGSPPEGPDESKLATIWMELLEMPSIGRDANFFELGGDSLTGLRLFSRIDRDFGVTLPLATLVQHPTVRSLARAIDCARTDPDPQATPGVFVELRKGSPTLFCIHGGDGAVMFYRPLLGNLPEEVGITAIESRELGRNEAVAVGTIEETADAYLRKIRIAQPHGPYALAGYSFGGVVAWEMACRLIEEGEEVELLGLFDTHNPAFPLRAMPLRRRIHTFWDQREDEPLPKRLFALGQRTVDGLRTHFRVKRELAAAAVGPAPAHSDLRRVQVREAHYQAMIAYRPRPFPGKVTLFKAMEGSDKYELPADYHWADLALGGFEIVPVPGRHDTLFEAKHIPAISRAIAEHFPVR
ncbi:hypothetical protein HAHE_27840 [Haloferula helveola]|uniref:Carrier domain-containing protein n=1 Tax=Haloferula helveola TaxID=490095 RepID=A0ABN6H5F5_9BACT|nr:hypothetical protein HAHE_27840 [Haloferula helveola]